MQTKLFSRPFQPAKDVLVTSPIFEATQDLEVSVNQWLAANPGIRINSVKQDLSFQSADPGFGHLVVSVWYEGNQ